jgi:phosphoesterase RecJ-like protein
MNDLQIKIKHRLQAASRVLITSHLRPDGDAVGSSLALALAMLDLGKGVQVVLSDGLPPAFSHLPGADLVRAVADGDFDLVVCLDCSDRKRIAPDLVDRHPTDILIDHHLTADPFGELNLLEPQAAATASILTRCMPAWGLKITPPVAANLLTGLITDTLGFRTSSTTPETLRQAADLLELGVDMPVLYNRSLVSRTFDEAKYWAHGLTSLSRYDGIIWATLTLADRTLSGYPGNDDADLINILSAIDDAQVAIMFVEQDVLRTKVSWRALTPDLDVSAIARHFHGGGHKAAAGAEMTGTLAQVQETVLTTSREMITHSPKKVRENQEE